MKYIVALVVSTVVFGNTENVRKTKILSKTDKKVENSYNITGNYSSSIRSRYRQEKKSLNARSVCKESQESGLWGFVNKMYDSLVDLSQDDVPLSCMKKYAELYEDGELNINLSLGYMDSKNEVYDEPMRDIFVAEITDRCFGDNFACGFTQDKEDAGLFTRTVKDVFGKEKKVVLKIAHSAATSSEKVNRYKSLGKIEQEVQTKIAEDNYFGGIKDGSEVVIYNGHSRSGGGPSFEPPTIKHGKTDYDWYKKHKPGFNRVLDELKNNKKDPQLMAFISCSSEDHFYEELKEAAPNTGFVMSKDLGYFTKGNAVALSTIDSVLGLKCEDTFEKNIEKSGLYRKNWVLNDFFRS